MTTITITVNLSDLVDVINNSNNPMVCKHLLSGGSMQDLAKFGDHDRFLHKVITRTMTDGSTAEAVIIVESYDPWTDQCTIKFYEGDKDAFHWGTRKMPWHEWCSLPTAEYGLDWTDAAPALEPDVKNWCDVETPEREDGWDNSI